MKQAHTHTVRYKKKLQRSLSHFSCAPCSGDKFARLVYSIMEVDGVGERVGDPFCRYVVASTVEISTVEAAGKAVEPQPGLRDEA